MLSLLAIGLIWVFDLLERVHRCVDRHLIRRGRANAYESAVELAPRLESLHESSKPAGEGPLRRFWSENRVNYTPGVRRPRIGK
jgi:hypothetical protein